MRSPARAICHSFAFPDLQWECSGLCATEKAVTPWISKLPCVGVPPNLKADEWPPHISSFCVVAKSKKVMHFQTCCGSSWYLFWHWRRRTGSSECEASWVNTVTLVRDRVQLPSLSVSSDHWFSVGGWEITWIHKFSIAFERTTQQTESTRQLMLPVIDVNHNSCTLYYSALYSCINQGCTACFLCCFSSQVPQGVASIVNGIYGVFWIFSYCRRAPFPSDEYMQQHSLFVCLFACDSQMWKSPSLSCAGGRWGFHVLPMLAQLHSFREEHVCISPSSYVPFYGESVTECLSSGPWGLWAVPWVPGLQQQSFPPHSLKLFQREE